MTDGELPNAPRTVVEARSRRKDVALFAVVVVVIVMAMLFRSWHTTERGPRAPSGARGSGGPRPSGSSFFAVPGANNGVKTDLRNIAVLQEVFFADSIHYASDLAQLTLTRPLRLTSGANIRILWGSAAGWAAVAEGGPLVGGSCVVRIGAVPDSLRPRTKLQHREGAEAEPRCDGDP